MSPTYVLIHGSWHTGADWAEVVTALATHGITDVHTPTVAGHGVGVPKNVTHNDCVQSIVDYVLEHDLRDVVLVGHSYGGTIVSRLYEELPDRIRRLVYLNAFVLAPNECLNDNTPPVDRAALESLALASADDTISMPFELWRERFIGDADVALAQRTHAGLSPEPAQPWRDRLPLDRFYDTIERVGRSYINCTEDISIPQGEWSWHPRMSQRLRNPRLVQLHGSHETLFTNPPLLAAKIVEAGRD